MLQPYLLDSDDPLFSHSINMNVDHISGTAMSQIGHSVSVTRLARNYMLCTLRIIISVR